PTQDGRNMTMMLGPSKAVLAGKVDSEDPAHEHAADEDPAHEHAADEDAAHAPEASETPSNGAVSLSETPVSQEGGETLAEVSSDAAAAEIQNAAPESVAPAAESQNGASDGAVS
ncbi:MAG: hypothetical protein WAU77_10510, partial [Solirubrobacteraceae bacterium]